jgi:hypothetical protein
MSSQLFVVFRGLYPVAPPYVISVVRIHRIWRRAEPLAPIDGIVLLMFLRPGVRLLVRADRRTSIGTGTFVRRQRLGAPPAADPSER